MSTITQKTTEEKLSDAALSLKAVKNYQLARRSHGSKRVCLYFDDVEGDWLKRFDDVTEVEKPSLSQDLCDI